MLSEAFALRVRSFCKPGMGTGGFFVASQLGAVLQLNFSRPMTTCIEQFPTCGSSMFCGQGYSSVSWFAADFFGIAGSANAGRACTRPAAS